MGSFPRVEVQDLDGPLTPAIVSALKNYVQEYNRLVSRVNHVSPVEGTVLKETISLLQTLNVRGMGTGYRCTLAGTHVMLSRGLQPPIRSFLSCPDVKLLTAMRFLALTQCILWRPEWSPRSFHFSWGWRYLMFFRTTHRLDFTLREVAACLPAIGLDPEGIADILARPGLIRGSRGPLPIPPEMVWPYFSDRLDFLAEPLENPGCVGPYELPLCRQAIFRILQCFPTLPEGFEPHLWEVALGNGKTERPMAQACLASVPHKISRLVEALRDRRHDTRREAALWLARCGSPEVVEPLRFALKREKQEPVRAALFYALESLGVALNDILDRRLLETEATGANQHPTPDWFPWDALPTVLWTTGEPVATECVVWMIVQSHRLKTPQPGSVLRYLMRLMSEVHGLANFVLQAWMDHDTIRQYTEFQANDEARRRLPQYSGGYPGRTDDQIVSAVVRDLRMICIGSAINDKGLLAVAAAGGDASSVDRVRAYLNTWYGTRAAQSKTLVQMLAWMENPTATQMLLSLSRRFRTRGIQDEAALQVRLLAERRGWTLDELADRIIPTAGFENGSELELDYGPRQFRVRLGEDMSVTLRTADGVTLKSLPVPLKDDEPTLAAAARKQLAALRKELKSTVEAQTGRLYEAMLTQRTWRFEDWNVFLNEHPIMGPLCRRLVWCSRERTFRPLNDGSLTDVDDATVKLDETAPVCLAHACVPSLEIGGRWTQHFVDYETVPLFAQFDRDAYALPEACRNNDAIRDFEGHVVQAFTLRARATSLGYTRGTGLDGPWFYLYRRSFPSADIEIVLEFTGNEFPEKDRTVALLHLSFRRSQVPLPLSEVPPIMLSEAWNDLSEIAAAGSGFDADWETKTRPT